MSNHTYMTMLFCGKDSHVLRAFQGVSGTLNSKDKPAGPRTESITNPRLGPPMRQDLYASEAINKAGNRKSCSRTPEAETRARVFGFQSCCTILVRVLRKHYFFVYSRCSMPYIYIYVIIKNPKPGAFPP